MAPPLQYSNMPRFAPPKGHTRTASRSPIRSPIRQQRPSEDILSDLSPATTFELFTNPCGKLKASIEAATPLERAFGIRATLASKKIQEWVDELSDWPWPTQGDGSSGFQTPVAKRRKISSPSVNTPSHPDGAGRSVSIELPEPEYIGALLAPQVERYENRVDQIQGDMEDLNVDEIKRQVLDNHFFPRSRPSSSSSSAPPMPSLFNSYTRMDDFTAIVTATVLRSLPILSQLLCLMDKWSVRLNVLRKVPPLMVALDDAEVALDSGWKAIEVSDHNHAMGKEQTQRCDEVLTQEAFEIMRGVLQDKVMKLGQDLDYMLDALEGREDTIPNKWLDRMEAIEENYGSWVAIGERKVREGEWLKMAAVTKADEDAKELRESEAAEMAKRKAAEFEAEENAQLAAQRHAEEIQATELAKTKAETENVSDTKIQESATSATSPVLQHDYSDRRRDVLSVESIQTLDDERDSSKSSKALLIQNIVAVDTTKKGSDNDDGLIASMPAIIDDIATPTLESTRSMDVEASSDVRSACTRCLELDTCRKIHEPASRLGLETPSDLESDCIRCSEIETRSTPQSRPAFKSSSTFMDTALSTAAVTASKLIDRSVSPEHENTAEYQIGRYAPFDGTSKDAPQPISIDSMERRGCQDDEIHLENENTLNASVSTQDSYLTSSLRADNSSLNRTSLSSISSNMDLLASTQRLEKQEFPDIPTFDGTFLDTMRGSSSPKEGTGNPTLFSEPSPDKKVMNIFQVGLILNAPPRMPMRDTSLGDGASNSDNTKPPASETLDDGMISATQATDDGIPSEAPALSALPALVEGPGGTWVMGPPQSVASVARRPERRAPIQRPQSYYGTETASRDAVAPRPRSYYGTESDSARPRSPSKRSSSPSKRHSRNVSVPSGFLSGYSTSNHTPELEEVEPAEYFRPTLSPVKSVTTVAQDYEASTPLPPFVFPGPRSLIQSLSDISSPETPASPERLDPTVGPTFDEWSTMMSPVAEESPVSNTPLLSIEVEGRKTQQSIPPIHARRTSLVRNDNDIRRISVPRRKSVSSDAPTVVVSGRIPDRLSPPLASPSSDLNVFPEDSPSAGRIGQRTGKLYDLSPPDSPPSIAWHYPRPSLQLLASPTFTSSETSSLYPSTPSTPLDAPVFGRLDVSSTPMGPSPKKAGSENQMQEQISSILESIPARIHLTTEPSSTPSHAETLRPKKSRRSVTPSYRPSSSMSSYSTSSRAPTPSFTLAPAFSKTTQRSRPAPGQPEIKLYHLSKGTGEAPIKLFVRLVGENGERVMVRVGGGWADLGEYLKEYASHHGRRSASTAFGAARVEIQDLPSRIVSTSSVASSSTVRGSGRTTPGPGSQSVLERERPGSSLFVRKPRKSVGEESDRSAGVRGAVPPRISNSDTRSPSTPLSTEIRRSFETPSSAESARSGSRMSWTEEDYSLGLAGPNAKNRNISEQDEEWVESMKQKVRVASAEKERRTRERERVAREKTPVEPNGGGSASIAGADRRNSRVGGVSDSGWMSRASDGRASRASEGHGRASFGEIEKVGSTKRLFRKG